MTRPYFLGISAKFLNLRLFCRSWLHVHADGLLAHLYTHKSVAWLPSFSSNTTSYNCFVLNIHTKTAAELRKKIPGLSTAKLFVQLDPSSSCKGDVADSHLCSLPTHLISVLQNPLDMPLASIYSACNTHALTGAPFLVSLSPA